MASEWDFFKHSLACMLAVYFFLCRCHGEGKWTILLLCSLNFLFFSVFVPSVVHKSWKVKPKCLDCPQVVCQS